MWSMMALVYICRLHVERDKRGRRGEDGEGEWCGQGGRGEGVVMCRALDPAPGLSD